MDDSMVKPMALNLPEVLLIVSQWHYLSRKHDESGVRNKFKDLVGVFGIDFKNVWMITVWISMACAVQPGSYGFWSTGHFTGL